MSVFNLVATRAVSSDRRALLAWYAEHVTQLLGTGELRRADLWAVQSCSPGAPPVDYLCRYWFDDLAAFDRYEATPRYAEVQHEVRTGWAKDGIAILFRGQYAQAQPCPAADHDANTLVFGALVQASRALVHEQAAVAECLRGGTAEPAGLLIQPAGGAINVPMVWWASAQVVGRWQA